MKYKWQKALTAIGYSEDQLSKSLQNQISDFRDVELSIQQLTDSLNELPEDAEEDRNRINEEIRDFQTTLTALDEKLAKKINEYPAKRQQMIELAAKRGQKKSGSSTPPVEPAPQDPPPSDPPPADPAPQDPPPSDPPPVEPAPQDPPPSDPPKKKGDGGWLGIGIGIGLALLTFGIYQYKKNNG